MLPSLSRLKKLWSKATLTLLTMRMRSYLVFSDSFVDSVSLFDNEVALFDKRVRDEILGNMRSELQRMSTYELQQLLHDIAKYNRQSSLNLRSFLPFNPYQRRRVTDTHEPLWWHSA